MGPVMVATPEAAAGVKNGCGMAKPVLGWPVTGVPGLGFCGCVLARSATKCVVELDQVELARIAHAPVLEQELEQLVAERGHRRVETLELDARREREVAFEVVAVEDERVGLRRRVVETAVVHGAEVVDLGGAERGSQSAFANGQLTIP